MQERVESDNTEKFIVHESLDRFIVNSHAFHNAHLLRAAFPDLLALIPLFEDQKANMTSLPPLCGTHGQTNEPRRKPLVKQPRRKVEDERGKPHLSPNPTVRTKTTQVRLDPVNQ
jgi:hypothetical protein